MIHPANVIFPKQLTPVDGYSPLREGRTSEMPAQIVPPHAHCIGRSKTGVGSYTPRAFERTQFGPTHDFAFREQYDPSTANRATALADGIQDTTIDCRCPLLLSWLGQKASGECP